MCCGNRTSMLQKVDSNVFVFKPCGATYWLRMPFVTCGAQIDLEQCGNDFRKCPCIFTLANLAKQISCLRVESKPARYFINKALSKEVATTTGTTLSQILHGFNQRSSRNLSSHSQPACTSLSLLDPFLFPSWVRRTGAGERHSRRHCERTL